KVLLQMTQPLPAEPEVPAPLRQLAREEPVEVLYGRPHFLREPLPREVRELFDEIPELPAARPPAEDAEAAARQHLGQRLLDAFERLCRLGRELRDHLGLRLYHPHAEGVYLLERHFRPRQPRPRQFQEAEQLLGQLLVPELRPLLGRGAQYLRQAR